MRTRRAGGEGDPAATSLLAGRVRRLRVPPHSIGIPGLFSVPTYVSLSVPGMERVSLWVLVLIGFGVGFLAGLLGAGGGFILMPILIYVLGVPTTVAIGTDLFQVIITGSVGTLLYALSNHVDLLMAVMMLAAASAGSQLGVAATRFVEPSRIRVLYGATVLSGAVAVGLRQASEAGPDFLATAASILLLTFAGGICVIIAALFAAEWSRRERTRSATYREKTREGS